MGAIGSFPGGGGSKYPVTEFMGVAQSDISKRDPVACSNGYYPLYQDNISTPPSGQCNGVAYSQDKVYMAVALYASPYIAIYKRNEDSKYEKLSNPAVLPAGVANDISFSPDGQYLAVVHASSPFLTVYKRTGDTFAKLANPSTLPVSTGYGVSFSPDSIYLAIAHALTPYISVYKFTGDVLAKLSSLTAVGSASYKVEFSPDGVYLAVTCTSSPYFAVYKRSTDSFTKLGNPSSLPSGSCYGVAFSPDGMYLAIGSTSCIVYKRNNDVFSKLDTLEAGSGSGFGMAFSANGKYLATSRTAASSVVCLTAWMVNGDDTFTRLNDPDIPPTSNGYDVAFTSDSEQMALALAGAPYIASYSVDASIVIPASTAQEIVDAGSIPGMDINGLGYARGTASLNEKVSVDIVFTVTA